jgi:enamine deaminase RidA (YjgF/YER057c/UK114 family)
MRTTNLAISTCAVALLFAVSATHAAASEKWPMVIPAPHGSVILPDENSKWAYDNFRYAAVRRVDDTLYISGVVIGPREGEKHDAAAFKQQIHRGFQRLEAILKSAGATFADVVMINSFHVWEGPNFEGNKQQHFALFEEVADTYLKPPYPAWTAVGTTGLLGTNSVIEVQLIAHVPKP